MSGNLVGEGVGMLPNSHWRRLFWDDDMQIIGWLHDNRILVLCSQWSNTG